MCIKCNCASLACIIQLSRTLNVLVLRSRALNALAQHASNTRVLLQFYHGMYECALLTVNLHVSCTVLTCILMHSFDKNMIDQGAGVEAS